MSPATPRFTARDDYWMRRALALATQAAESEEVPVGAVLIRDNELLAEGFNQPIATHDPTAHAEIVALRAAAASLSDYRLPGCTLYVTLEPCAMCAGAMLHARVERLVFAAPDPKSGAAGSVLDVPGCKALNHRMGVAGGLLAEESAVLLRSFFADRR